MDRIRLNTVEEAFLMSAIQEERQAVTLIQAERERKVNIIIAAHNLPLDVKYQLKGESDGIYIILPKSEPVGPALVKEEGDNAVSG